MNKGKIVQFLQPHAAGLGNDDNLQKPFNFSLVKVRAVQNHLGPESADTVYFDLAQGVKQKGKRQERTVGANFGMTMVAFIPSFRAARATPWTLLLRLSYLGVISCRHTDDSGGAFLFTE